MAFKLGQKQRFFFCGTDDYGQGSVIADLENEDLETLFKSVVLHYEAHIEKLNQRNKELRQKVEALMRHRDGGCAGTLG